MDPFENMDVPAFASLCLESSESEEKATVRTPGGRAGSDSGTGSRSNGENWVEQTSSGRLPRYIRIVRNGLMREGQPEGRATALAVAAIKRWAKGGDSVSPKVQAAAEAALAQWERMKGEKSDDEMVRSITLHAVTPEDVQPETEEKADSMKIQHKTVGVSAKTVEDEGDGIITAYVSVTGIKDNVNDIIEPGAYAETLKKRLPKGVWSHDWNTPVSKTLEAKELLPGDSDLPKTLPNGDMWPADAGALKVKMQFNLDTQRGRDAYADVKFFDDQQEWSIGYNVPNGGSTKDMKVGARRIKNLDLYEFSPVLFGAMPSARTAMGVKASQLAHLEYKSALGADYYIRFNLDELDDFVAEAKQYIHEGIETKSLFTEGTSPSSEDYEEDDEVLPIFNEKGVLSADNIHLLEKAADVLSDLIDALHAGTETKSVETKQAVSLAEAVDSLYETDLEEKTIEDLATSVEEFETAMEAKDDDTAEAAANDILDVVDDNLDSVDEKTAEALRGVAASLRDVVAGSVKDAGDPEVEEVEEETPTKTREEEEKSVQFDMTEVKSLESFLDSLG